MGDRLRGVWVCVCVYVSVCMCVCVGVLEWMCACGVFCPEAWHSAPG